MIGTIAVGSTDTLVAKNLTNFFPSIQIFFVEILGNLEA